MFLIESIRQSFGKASPFALHIFLIVGVIVYTIGGAFIIRYLESPERIRAANKKVETSTESLSRIDLSKLTGSELANLDPNVHDCVLLAVVNIFSTVGCDNDNVLDHSAISSLDECYRSAKVPGLGKLYIVGDEKEKTESTILSSIDDEVSVEISKWSFENALIFSFTVITTIGYGHIVPETTWGRVFVIVYGLIGVPLTLLTIADLGMFIAKALHYALCGLRKLITLIVRKTRKLHTPRSDRSRISIEEKKESPKSNEFKQEEENEDKEESHEDKPRSIDDTLALCAIFALYLLIGANVLASYEPDMGFFEAFYFNFVTLTTIGLGDFVPKSYDYLFLTLCYIGVGLALTTMAVEIMADGLRKLHYFGRTITNAATVFVWFGGEKMRLDKLIKNLGDQLNIPEEELLNFQMETFVEQAIKVEQGEMATLRRPVVMRPDRPFSYSQIRKSDESGALHFVDSTRSSKLGTVGLPPLALETGRSQTTGRLGVPTTRAPTLRRMESNEKKLTRVRFSQTSFAGSDTANSMDYYSEEELSTMRNRDCEMLVISFILFSIASFTKAELLQVQMVIRHSDRAPMIKFTSDEYKKIFYRGLGQLSDEGIRNAARQGAAFRERYQQLGFDSLDAKDESLFVYLIVYIRSSPVTRVLMSAASFSSSFVDKPLQPKIHTNDFDKEKVLIIHNSPEFKCMVAQKHGLNDSKCDTNMILSKLIKEFSECSPFSYYDIEAGIAEIENSAVQMNASLEACVRLRGRRILYKHIVMNAGVGDELNIPRATDVIGQLLAIITRNIDNVALRRQREVQHPFKIYYTHDNIILPLAEALGIEGEFHKRNPEFSSAIIIETWKNDEGVDINILKKDGVDAEFKPVATFDTLTDFKDRLRQFEISNETNVQWDTNTEYSHDEFINDMNSFHSNQSTYLNVLNVILFIFLVILICYLGRKVWFLSTMTKDNSERFPFYMNEV